MPVETDYGPRREVWFAKLSDPSTKWSFVVRDDAHIKTGTPVGRQIRLGDPINTGPNSNWQQLTWEGGVKQEVWKDDQMFQEGSADVDTKVGKVRMWPGWESLYGERGRTIHGYIFARGGGLLQGGVGSPTYLWFGESDYNWLSLPFPPFSPYAGWILRRYDPFRAAIPGQTGITDVKSFTSPISNILAASADADNFYSGWICVTPKEGRMAFINEETLEYFEDPNAPNADPGAGWYFYNSMVNYQGAIYYTFSQILRKRGEPFFATAGTHTDVKGFHNAIYVNALCVHQNRLWFSVTTPGFKTSIMVSDGNVVSEAFSMPEDFVTWSMCSHYGSLYISGGKPTRQNIPKLGSIGMVWKYNGSSLIKLWSEGIPDTEQWQFARKVVGVGPYVVWGRSAMPNGTEEETCKRPGLMMYNVEKDALFEGPSFDPDPTAVGATDGVFVEDVIPWRGRLVASFRDIRMPAGVTELEDLLRVTPQQWQDALYRQVAVLTTRIGDNVRNDIDIPGESGSSFEYQPATKSQYVLSSRYDGGGDVSAESKTWLTGRLRVKVPTADCQVRVYARLDESTNDQLVTTVSYDAGNTGWRTVTFPMKVSGAYLKSAVLQYKLSLDSLNTAATSTAEVDSIDIEWTVAPKKRRSWRMRIMCDDNQLRLDGSANSLTTAQAQSDKLEELWSEHQPILFWDANAAGGAPGGSGVEVNPLDFNEASYRVDSEDPEVMREVSLTVVENVTT